ncbi:MAG TPA: acetyl-CoA C-acyltransferase [Candidatus Acidoferrales bacterium]
MREAVIVSAVRTAVGKAYKGTLRAMRPDDMAAVVIREAIARVPGLKAEEVEDIILGCAMPEAEQGMNVARIAALRAGLPNSISAMTINRFCSSGLQSIAMAAERILAGFADVIVAGGTESMSLVPMGGHKISPNPWLIENYPDSYLSMGVTAELIAQKYGISRDEQDAFSLASHRKAVKAIAESKFQNEIIPLDVTNVWVDEKGKRQTQTLKFATDEGPRADTSLDALAKLKPAFSAEGSITAGNSSQMSDGAAAAVVMSADRARALGAKPMAKFLAFATGGVAPEEMGVGPVVAIPKALKLAGLKLSDIAVIELNEAFAAQALSVIKVAGLDPARVNPNGGAVALGHPLGCTGAKLTATLLGELERRPPRRARYGMVTMCVGGGMGAAGIFERIE